MTKATLHADAIAALQAALAGYEGTLGCLGITHRRMNTLMLVSLRNYQTSEMWALATIQNDPTVYVPMLAVLVNEMASARGVGVREEAIQPIVAVKPRRRTLQRVVRMDRKIASQADVIWRKHESATYYGVRVEARR